MIHIEVKTGRISGEEIIGEYSEQIMKQRKRLEELFEIFCQCIGEEKCAAKWSEFFSAPSVVGEFENDQNVETTEFLYDTARSTRFFIKPTSLKNF